MNRAGAARRRQQRSPLARGDDGRGDLSRRVGADGAPSRQVRRRVDRGGEDDLSSTEFWRCHHDRRHRGMGQLVEDGATSTTWRELVSSVTPTLSVRAPRCADSGRVQGSRLAAPLGRDVARLTLFTIAGPEDPVLAPFCCSRSGQFVKMRSSELFHIYLQPHHRRPQHWQLKIRLAVPWPPWSRRTCGRASFSAA